MVSVVEPSEDEDFERKAEGERGRQRERSVLQNPPVKEGNMAARYAPTIYCTP